MIDEIACRWAAVIDRGLLPDETAELESWLAADRRHRGALLRAQAGMSLLDRCRALGEAEDAEQDAAEDRTETPEADNDDADEAHGRRNRRQVMMLAGAGMASAVIGALTWRLWPQGTQISTDIGEMRRVPLADGSMAVINSASQLRVSFSSERRDIDLAQGEAWFQVAKMPDRPFTVTAGPVRVQAVGTAFNVRRSAKGVEVVVTEGTVKVWSADSQLQMVHAGNRAFLRDGAPAARVTSVSPELSEQELAWRDGQIVLNDVPLSDAVSRFNAYHADQLEVSPSLIDKRVVGSFQTNDMEGFASACAAMVGGRVERRGNVIRIVP